MTLCPLRKGKWRERQVSGLGGGINIVSVLLHRKNGAKEEVQVHPIFFCTTFADTEAHFHVPCMYNQFKTYCNLVLLSHTTSQAAMNGRLF